LKILLSNSMQVLHEKLQPMFKNIPLEIVGGIIVIAFATFIFTSNDSVPGEVSYLMDRGLEQISYMSVSPSHKVEFRLEQLRERIDEYEEIVIYEVWGDEKLAIIECQAALKDLLNAYNDLDTNEQVKIKEQVDSITKRVEGLLEYQKSQDLKDQVENTGENMQNSTQQHLKSYFLY